MLLLRSLRFVIPCSVAFFSRSWFVAKLSSDLFILFPRFFCFLPQLRCCLIWSSLNSSRENAKTGTFKVSKGNRSINNGTSPILHLARIFLQQYSIDLAMFHFLFQCAYTYPAVNWFDFVKMSFHHHLLGPVQLAMELKSFSCWTGTEFNVCKPNSRHVFLLRLFLANFVLVLLYNRISCDSLARKTLIAAVQLSGSVQISVLTVTLTANKSHVRIPQIEGKSTISINCTGWIGQL